MLGGDAGGEVLLESVSERGRQEGHPHPKELVTVAHIVAHADDGFFTPPNSGAASRTTLNGVVFFGVDIYPNNPSLQSTKEREKRQLVLTFHRPIQVFIGKLAGKLASTSEDKDVQTDSSWALGHRGTQLFGESKWLQQCS